MHPQRYGYTQFSERYRRSAGALKPSMRPVYRAGERQSVDFSGRRPQLVDRRTGELIPLELFFGVLGASRLIHAEATPPQDRPSWIGAHIRMHDYFQGTS